MPRYFLALHYLDARRKTNRRMMIFYPSFGLLLLRQRCEIFYGAVWHEVSIMSAYLELRFDCEAMLGEAVKHFVAVYDCWY